MGVCESSRSVLLSQFKDVIFVHSHITNHIFVGGVSVTALWLDLSVYIWFLVILWMFWPENQIAWQQRAHLHEGLRAETGFLRLHVFLHHLFFWNRVQNCDWSAIQSQPFVGCRLQMFLRRWTRLAFRSSSVLSCVKNTSQQVCKWR